MIALSFVRAFGQHHGTGDVSTKHQHFAVVHNFIRRFGHQRPDMRNFLLDERLVCAGNLRLAHIPVVDFDFKARPMRRSTSATSGDSRKSSVPGLNASPSTPTLRLPLSTTSRNAAFNLQGITLEHRTQQREFPRRVHAHETQPRANLLANTSRQMRNPVAGTPVKIEFPILTHDAHHFMAVDALRRANVSDFVCERDLRDRGTRCRCI